MENKGLSRADFQNSIIIGVIGGKEANEKALKAMNELFPDKHIHIMDKDLYNQTIQAILNQHIKWTEDQAILEYTQKPENIQLALQVLNNAKLAVGVNWFLPKDMVENTNMGYKQVQETLDLLFAFGYAAKRQSESNSKLTEWVLLPDLESKENHVRMLIKQMRKDATDLSKIADQIKKERQKS